jgi:hypothetical protein
LTKVGLKTRPELGLGNPGVANWFSGDKDMAGVIPNSGEGEKE